MDEIELKKPEERRPKPISLNLPKRRVVWPWFLLLSLVILALAGYIVYEKFYLTNSAVKSVTADQTTTGDEVDTTTTTAKKVEALTDTGVTWVTPKKLGDLGLFIKNAGFEGMGEYSGTDYYSSGTTATGGEIIIAFPQTSPKDNTIYRFIKRGDKYYFLTKNSSTLPQSDGPFSSGKFESDSNYVLQSLLPDTTVTKGNTVLVYQFTGNITDETSFTSGGSLWQTKWGDLYLENGAAIDGSENKVVISRYYLKLNDGSRAYYSTKPAFMKDDNTMDLTWTPATAAATAFEKLPTSGCGSGFGSFPKVVADTDLSAKVSVAKYQTKDAVFHFADAAALLNKFGYNLYKSDGMADKKPIADYIADLGLVIWNDDFDSTVIYANSKYIPAIECGKPVVYLYPEQETAVSVKVAADISKSDPEYGQGWNVLAEPDGTLKTSAGVYSNLFWEGIGKGVYPTVNSGLVVTKSQAPAIIKLQLKAMGLNDQEIADFSVYWLPKLPDNAYIRLTWFGTKEMNELAPIRITPAPDSILRVFLDFQGLDTPIAIAPQVLPHFTRSGFTAVEWGGLLRTAK